MKRIISDLPHARYRGRAVLVRVDVNVPLDHSGGYHAAEDMEPPRGGKKAIRS